MRIFSVKITKNRLGFKMCDPKYTKVQMYCMYFLFQVCNDYPKLIGSNERAILVFFDGLIQTINNLYD